MCISDSPRVAAAAYAIASESVVNAARHSGAPECRLTVRLGDGALVVPCADDGRGVAPAAVAGVGSRALRARLELVRARLQARAKVPFLVVCMSILGAALLCALLVNTTMARNSYEMSELRREVSRVAQDTQRLQQPGAEQRTALAEAARRVGIDAAQAPAGVGRQAV